MASMLSMFDFVKTEPLAGPVLKPQSIAEIDVPQAILEDLALKILYLSGSLSVLELADKTRLSFELVDELFSHLRAERFCQVTGMAGNIPHISITSQGRTRAVELLSQSQYSGPAPDRKSTRLNPV